MEYHSCNECRYFCCFDLMTLNQKEHPCKEFKPKMNREQYKALYDFCETYNYNKFEVLRALKENGSIDKNATVGDIGDYVNGNTYDAMRKFLEDNLLW